MDLNVLTVPLRICRRFLVWERGSTSEWTCNCNRIFSTSRGATQNLWMHEQLKRYRNDRAVNSPWDQSRNSSCSHYLICPSLRLVLLVILRFRRVRCRYYLVLKLLPSSRHPSSISSTISRLTPNRYCRERLEQPRVAHCNNVWLKNEYLSLCKGKGWLSK